jgi:hypothetical protein
MTAMPPRKAIERSSVADTTGGSTRLRVPKMGSSEVATDRSGSGLPMRTTISASRMIPPVVGLRSD